MIKKQVMKLLRMAKKEGDREAAKLLAHIRNNDLMEQPVICDKCRVICNTTHFTWADVRIAYDGHDDEITVYWGDNRWTLCE